MSTLALEGGVKPGTFTPLGRSEMGLAGSARSPHPDISTVDTLAAVLLAAQSKSSSSVPLPCELAV